MLVAAYMVNFPPVRTQRMSAIQSPCHQIRVSALNPIRIPWRRCPISCTYTLGPTMRSAINKFFSPSTRSKEVSPH